MSGSRQHCFMCRDKVSPKDVLQPERLLNDSAFRQDPVFEVLPGLEIRDKVSLKRGRAGEKEENVNSFVIEERWSSTKRPRQRGHHL
jgi:hypothetical protein